MSFLSDLLVPARLFNAKLSHFSHFHEIQEIYVFVFFFSIHICNNNRQTVINVKD